MTEASNNNNKQRNQMAAKGAAPKTGSAAAPPPAPAAEDARGVSDLPLGARIQITTIKPDSKTHQGVLFAVDRKLNLVAINTALAPPNPSTPLISLPGDYHVILMRNILSFQLLSGPEESDPPAGNEPLPIITQQEMARLRDREQKAVQKLKDEERKKGKGVTPEIQELFNGIERMYTNQTRWDGQSIILMDAVRLDPPHRPEDLKAPKDKAHMLPMLRKVVEGERKKAVARVGTPPVSGRKGG